jgi:hypothetical protein
MTRLWRLWRVEFVDARLMLKIIYIRLPDSDKIRDLFRALGCRVKTIDEELDT